MTKSDIRKQMIKKLTKLSATERKQIEESMHQTLFLSDIWNDASTIGVTIHQEGVEWDTASIIERAWEEGKRVVVPKCFHSDRSMKFYDFRSYDELEVVYFNLKEPIPNEERVVAKEEIELLIVPGVVFDRKGYRIGFGGGYYDRFLANFTQATTSLVSAMQLIENIPTESYDVAVQSMVTEDGLIK